MRAFVMIGLSVALGGCSSPEPKTETAPVAEQVRPPTDESRRFPKDGQTKMELVDNHLLGKDYFKGGNLASYERDGKQYRQFLLQAADEKEALDLLSAVKEDLEDRKFVAAFGGYYGQNSGEGWFVFLKQNYLLGIVGLEQAEADLIARDFAARIH